MTSHKERSTVMVGGRQVPDLVAALLAQEADRLGILPRRVGDVVIPTPAPTHVRIAGYRLTITTAAAIATVADAQGMHPRRVLESIVEEQTEALNRRARRRDTGRTLEGAWLFASRSSRGRRGGA